MYLLKGVVIVIFISIKWAKNVTERAKVIWYCICLKAWNWACKIHTYVTLKSVNSSHRLVIFEDHSIYLKYNGAQASAVLSKVYCSTSQHNSILLTCENLYVNIVRDIEISVGSVFALCSFMLFLFDWFLYCSRDYLCWRCSSSTQSFQFSAKLHVLERNCICSTLLRPNELLNLALISQFTTNF